MVWKCIESNQGCLLDNFKLVFFFISCHILIIILNLILHKCYRVASKDNDHVDRILEVYTNKVFKDAFFNARLQVTNAFVM